MVNKVKLSPKRSKLKNLTFPSNLNFVRAVCLCNMLVFVPPLYYLSAVDLVQKNSGKIILHFFLLRLHPCFISTDLSNTNMGVLS